MPAPFPDAAALAVLDRDTAAIRQAATDLGAAAAPITDGGDLVVRTWRGVDPHYVAPESPVLVAALDPVLTESQQVGDDAGEAGRILGVWADDAEPLVTEGRTLADTALPATPQAEETLVLRLNQILAELRALDDQCARDLAALVPDVPLAVLPPRVRVGETVHVTSTELTAGFAELGHEFRVMETRFSDGHVEFTLVNQAGAAGTAALGPKLVAGDAGLEGRIEAEAGAELTNGTTWLVEPGRVEEFRGQLGAYLADRQSRLTTAAAVGNFVPPFGPAGSLTAAAGVILADVLLPRPFLPPPTRVDTTVGLPVELKGKAEAATPDSGAGGIAGSAGVEPRWSGRQVMADGSTVSVYGGPATASGEVSRFGDTSGVGQSINDNIAVTRDVNGQVTRVVLSSTTEAELSHEVGRDQNLGSPAGRDPHEASAAFSDGTTLVDVTTTTLDVDDTNRAVVEQWVADRENDRVGSLDDGGPLGSVAEGDRFYPETAAEGDPFQNVLHTDATVTRVQQENVTEGAALGGTVSAGPGVGAEVGSETTTSQATGGTYLDAPDIHGNRVERPLPGIPN
ncbi:MAG: hypothetical protein ACRCXL_10545 [Dermatophilaceae bacterium]